MRSHRLAKLDANESAAFWETGNAQVAASVPQACLLPCSLSSQDEFASLAPA